MIILIASSTISRSSAQAARASDLQGVQAASAHSPDIHQALAQVRERWGAHPKPSLLDHFPWLKESLLNLRQSISEFFGTLFGHLFNALPNLSAIPGLSKQSSIIISTTIAVFLCFILLLGLFMLLRWYRRGREARRSRALSPLNKPFGDTLLVSARHHWEQAQGFARDENFEAAICQLYYAILCRLDESKTIRYDESLTNIEYEQMLRELFERQDGREKNNADNRRDTGRLFRNLALRFEAVQYGRHPLQPASFALSQTDYEALSNLLTLSGHPAPGCETGGENGREGGRR